jgi:hypothetical protein
MDLNFGHGVEPGGYCGIYNTLRIYGTGRCRVYLELRNQGILPSPPPFTMTNACSVKFLSLAKKNMISLTGFSQYI